MALNFPHVLAGLTGFNSFLLRRVSYFLLLVCLMLNGGRLMWVVTFGFHFSLVLKMWVTPWAAETCWGKYLNQDLYIQIHIFENNRLFRSFIFMRLCLHPVLLHTNLCQTRVTNSNYNLSFTAFRILYAMVDGFGSVLVGQESTPPLAPCSVSWSKQQRNGMTDHMITLSWGCLVGLSEVEWPNGITESYASDPWAGCFGRAIFIIDNLVVNCHEGNCFKDISTNENFKSYDGFLYANKK